MNRKKKYATPAVKVVAMDSTAMLGGSGRYDKYKVTGQTEDSDYPLEYGGEGGGAMYDPD